MPAFIHVIPPKYVLTIVLLVGLIPVQAQPLHYTPGNAHSHNDYENPVPFWTAYNAGFGSIEADIWLQPDGKLLVGHDLNEIKSGRTLEQYYLDPMEQSFEKNHHHIYADTSKHLQLLVDVKTEGVSTLKRLMEVLQQQYPHLIDNSKISFVISGNRPAPEAFTSYPSFICFDGDPLHTYTEEQQKKIGLLSDNFIKYALWSGNDSIPAVGLVKLQDAISKAHSMKKPIRFWASPDKPNAWQQLMKLGVDYINTDHINELAEYLK